MPPAAVLCLTAVPDSWFENPLASTSCTIEYVGDLEAVEDLDRYGIVLVDGDTVSDPVAVIERVTDAPTSPAVVYLAADPDDDRVDDAFSAGAAEYASGETPSALSHRIERLRTRRERFEDDDGPDGESDAAPAGATLSEDARLVTDSELLEAVLRDLFADPDVTLYFKDEESRFIRVSESMSDLYGMTREELRGLTDFDLMPESEARPRYENEQAIMEGGDVVEDPDERLPWHDGVVRRMHSKKMPLRDEQGEVIGTLGISRNVTDLKNLEETLGELEELIDEVPVALLAADDEGEITWANHVADRSLGADGGSLLGERLTSLARNGPLNPSFLERYGNAFSEILESDAEQTVIEDVVVRPTPDERRTCNVHVRLLPLADGSFRGTVLAFHDVTTQAEQERILERQYDQLERLVETISHDLRNPLLVATSKVDLAAETVEEESLDEARAALERMDTMIEELLTMTRLGRSVEATHPLSVQSVADRAWRPFEDSSATLVVEDDWTVHADEDRLVRLFENLYRNACEHGPADVHIRVGGTDQGFFVADDGPGIPEEHGTEVLEPGFSTSDDGSGLGLSIVDEIASAHGWTVRVSESAAGGARFDVVTD